ncbi:MAG: hypothetical protein RL716_63 [Actinomycetota bacterium]|jgi:hypothetical protein
MLAIEKPEYRVVGSGFGIELRDYAEHWLAECDQSAVADLRIASNRAFNNLFRYISGENSENQKISMTSPVQQVPSAQGWKVSFVVPKLLATTGIPGPASGAIQLRKVEAGRFAALRYRGLWDQDIFMAKRNELLAAVEKFGLKPVGEVSSAIYNPPLTPPILRRNEVLVRVSD